MAITATGRSAWRIETRGDLNTVRFDDRTAGVPDYQRSRGVIGHTPHNGSLYVTLDPTVAVIELVLRPDRKGRATGERFAHLVDSRWMLSGVTVEPCRVRGRAQGFGAGEMTWDGLTPGGYRLSSGEPARISDVDVGQDGRLSITLPGSGIAGMTFDLACR